MSKDLTEPDPGRGERIRVLRLQRGLTMARLANSLGTDKSTVQRWEKGAQFKVGYLAPMCDLLGCSSDYLLGREAGSAPQVDPPEFAAFLEWLDNSRWAELSDPDVVLALRRASHPGIRIPLHVYKQMFFQLSSIERELT